MHSSSGMLSMSACPSFFCEHFCRFSSFGSQQRHARLGKKLRGSEHKLLLNNCQMNLKQLSIHCNDARFGSEADIYVDCLTSLSIAAAVHFFSFHVPRKLSNDMLDSMLLLADWKNLNDSNEGQDHRTWRCFMVGYVVKHA